MNERNAKHAVDVPAIAVLGAGTMGPGIVAAFAARGVAVHWLVRAAARHAAARAALRDALASVEPHAVGAVTLHSDLEAMPLDTVGLVIETITEDLQRKRALFARLDALAAPNAVLASNSSSLAISAIAGDLPGRARTLGVHFFMPAQLVPLVELVPAAHTAPHLIETVGAWLRAIGKRPVHVRREVPGFLANRLQAALMREALWLIEDGVASPQDIDDAVRYGFGFRYAAAGPILQKEHSGWDTTCAVAKIVYPTLHGEPSPPPVLERNVDAGRVGFKSGAGFYAWTPEAIAAERARYERALRRCLEIFRDESGDRHD
jgi:3-hydroxybutyryl-CoA dehydrogenase